MQQTRGHIEVVERLLQDPRVDPSVDDNDALVSACENGHSEVALRLLQDGRVDPSTDSGKYALELADRNNLVEVVDAFLRDPRVVGVRSDGCVEDISPVLVVRGVDHVSRNLFYLVS